jgi:hypothetical protein
MIKLYSWIAYDVFLSGLFVYNWFVLQAQAFTATLDVVEKSILFLCTVTFAGYRIVILHLDAEKKRLENRNMKHELNEKRAKRG